MKPGMRQALTIALLIFGIWFYETMRPVGQPPGVLAPDPPGITPAAEKPAIFERDGHVLTALAGFEAKARVLSVERYGRDRLARIAPLDLALGWDRLSDTTTFRGVDVAQTERRVVFKSWDPKLSDDEVAASVLNVHVIAANVEVEKELDRLRTGNIVQLRGWLVEAVSGDGWRSKGEARSSPPEMPGNLLWVERVEAS
jgi:hypothetical protein